MDIKEMSSWGLTKAMLDVIENGIQYDLETGEIFFTEDDIEALEEALDTKMNSICGYIKYNESKAEALKNRKKEIDSNIKYFENKAEKLKSYLQTLLEYNKIDGKKSLDDYTISFRKSSKLNIKDETKVMSFIESNEDLKETALKVSKSIIKDSLKSYIKEGNVVDGVEIVESKGFSIK